MTGAARALLINGVMLARRTLLLIGGSIGRGRHRSPHEGVIRPNRADHQVGNLIALGGKHRAPSFRIAGRTSEVTHFLNALASGFLLPRIMA